MGASQCKKMRVRVVVVGGGPVEEQCDLGSREKVEMKKGLAFSNFFFLFCFFGGRQSRDPRLFRGPLQRRRTDGRTLFPRPHSEAFLTSVLPVGSPHLSISPVTAFHRTLVTSISRSPNPYLLAAIIVWLLLFFFNPPNKTKQKREGGDE